MKYSLLFLFLINTVVFGQTNNKQVQTLSDPYVDIKIIIDSIEKFKHQSDNNEIAEPEYSVKREKLKNDYTEKGKLIQEKYIEMQKVKDELPDYLQLKLKNIETTVFDILPNGNLPDDLREKLGYIKLISTYYNESKSIDKTLKLIKAENKKGIESNYYSSVNGINEFGYELMNDNKNNEALKVFNLNVSLYPKNSNVYDSLGECLLKLNKKEEGIKAYKKSLALDPENKNAAKIISET